MDASIAGLLAAIIGALAGLVGGYIAGRQQSQLEYQKWHRARLDDLNKEIRLAVAELARKLAITTHSMNWLTWRAEKQAAEFSLEHLEAYDREMHQNLPEIASAFIVLSALSESAAGLMNPLVQEVYNLDVDLAKAGASYREDPATSREAIASLMEDAWKLNHELTSRVAVVLKNSLV